MLLHPWTVSPVWVKPIRVETLRTLREAKAELRVFLARAIARQLRCVRIVHGKGRGILKSKLRKWLPQRDDVLELPVDEAGVLIDVDTPEVLVRLSGDGVAGAG